MLRILSTLPRVAVRTVARSAAIRALPACAARVQLVHTTQTVRAPKTNAPAPVEEQEVEEQEEERAPVPFPEARSKVVSTLAAEIASFDTTDEYAESYAKEHNLAVTANLDAETVVCTRSNEGHSIRITFRAEALETEEPQEEEEGEEEDKQDKLPEHKFLVDVTNPSGSIMRLECFNSPTGELEVGAVSFPASVSADPATVTREAADKAEENAPPALRVDEMSDEASESFFTYLEGLGVDDDLAVFVASQAQLVRTKAMIERLNKLKQFAQ